MTAPKSLRSRIQAQEWLAGSFINLGSPLSAEIAGKIGFDWLLLDFEHGPGSDETLLHQLQAIAATPAVPIVRIAANEPARFKRVLDLGAAGVMVPYVNTPDEARAAVAAVRYPPQGVRGVSKFNRAAGFGEEFAQYFARSSEDLVTVVQIETAQAVENAERIAAVDGVDVLFIGPLDLSVNLGVPAQFDSPLLWDAIRKTARAAKTVGKAVGILLTQPSQAAALKELGFSLVALGSDGGAVVSGLKQNLSALRNPKGA